MLIQRRHSYRSFIHKPDFFIVNHIYHFINRSLQELIAPPSLVLDIGCGEQPWKYVVEAEGGSYTGVDVVQNSKKSVDLLADITKLPVRANTFDIVICSEVLEHIADTADAFMEITRITKPGGYIILTTPFGYPLHEEPFDFVRLTPYNISLQAKRNSLEVIKLKTTGNEIEVIATILDYILIKMYPLPQPLFYKIIKILSRVIVNIGAQQLSNVFSSSLPSKSYLSVQSVLRKPVLS